MATGETILSFTKLVIATGVAGVAGQPFLDYLHAYVTTPFWGMPVSVIAAASFGAGLSLFFGDPLPTRRALYGQTIAATFFGAGLAVMLADGFEWQWAIKYTPLFALMSSAMVRWFLPSAIERVKQLIKEFKLPSIKKSNGDGQ